MITLHRAKIEEVAEIKKLLHETWMATYSEIYSSEAIERITSEWHSIERLTKSIQDSLSFFGVAKDGNKIVGMCNTTKYKGGVVNIVRLHVSPHYQRQGIGSQLINEAIKTFPKASKIDLEVEKQNYRALAFYKKHGFKKVGKKVFKVANVRLPCIVMEKTI